MDEEKRKQGLLLLQKKMKKMKKQQGSQSGDTEGSVSESLEPSMDASIDSQRSEAVLPTVLQDVQKKLHVTERMVEGAESLAKARVNVLWICPCFIDVM
jgi:hypothetical protein